MTNTADAVVIGGGILGVSTAHFLAKLGFGSVVLLEKNAKERNEKQLKCYYLSILPVLFFDSL